MTARTIKLCKEKSCPNAATTEGYCRFHYLKNWKTIKDKKKKSAIKNINRYVDHVIKQHPGNYMEVIREDLRHPDQFERKAEAYIFEDDFYDVMEELTGDDVTRLIDSIKVDESF